MPVGLFHSHFWEDHGETPPIVRFPDTEGYVLPWAVTSQLLKPRRPGGDHLRLDEEDKRKYVIEQYIEEALERHRAEVENREQARALLEGNLQYGRLVRELNVLRNKKIPENPNAERIFRETQRKLAARRQKREDAIKEANRIKMARVRAFKELKE